MVGVDRATTTDPGRGPADIPPDPPSRASGVLALLALATVAAALAGPWNPPLNEPVIELPPPALPEEGLPTLPALPPTDLLDRGPVQPWDLTWIGLILLAVIGVWIGYLALRWIRRHPPEPMPGPPDDAGILPGQSLTDASEAPNLPTLRAGVSTADQELRGDRSPADAVIAAWVALEAAAARSGVVRDRAATPTEFTVAVLDRTPADPGATRSLLALYLRARFGGEYMGPRDVAVATGALRALAIGLGPGLADEP
jgi:hypothetical protein